MASSEIAFSDPRIAIGSVIPANGADVRQSVDFEALEAEIGKLESEGPGSVDWAVVVRLGAHLLESEGKDLLVGCWLAHALSRLEGYRGLAAGIGIVHGMIEAHWTILQPPPSRERARARALEWFADRTAAFCEASPAGDEAPAVLYADETLDRIARLVGERQPAFPPDLGPLLRALHPHAETVRAARRDRDRRAAEDAAAAEARAAEPAPPPTASQPVETTAQAAPRSLQEPPRVAAAFDTISPSALPEALRDWSVRLIEHNTADSLAYGLSRLASWSRLRGLPPNEGGRTFATLPSDEAQAVQALIAEGRKVEALKTLNDLVWTAPFWFEGHFITARLLDELGPDYADAKTTVGGSVNLLLQRFPALVDLTFADGRPLIDSATRDWLAETGGGSSGKQADPLDRAQAEARSLVAGGRVPDAVKLLASLTEGDITGRSRFLRQVVQARLCLEIGLIATALPLLDHLDHALEAHALDTWEPSLAAEVAELRVRALTHNEASRLITEERRRSGLETARQRLAGLDLATASYLFR